MSPSTPRTKPYHNWLMLLPMIAGALWFYLLERIGPAPRIILHARLDDFIPFLPVFIIPYVIWYVSCSLTGLLLFFKDRDEFCRFAAYIAGGMLIACFVYTFWPNGQMLRPDLSGAQGPFAAMIRFLYSIDTPTNSSPSIHVTYAVGTHIALVRYNRRSKKKPWVAPVSLVLTVAICLSTVFVKQHSVICIVTGLLLSLGLYLLVYGKQTMREYKAYRTGRVLAPR